MTIAQVDPQSVQFMVADLENWARQGNHQDVVEPLVAACLQSADPFVRWSGIALAHGIGDSETAREALRKDYWTILIRPDPMPWWCVPILRPVDARFYRTEAASNTSGNRATVMLLLGAYGIREAVPLLEVIASNRTEWDPTIRSLTRRVITELAPSAATSESDN